jgi:hypothetical protein
MLPHNAVGVMTAAARFLARRDSSIVVTSTLLWQFKLDIGSGG